MICPYCNSTDCTPVRPIVAGEPRACCNGCQMHFAPPQLAGAKQPQPMPPIDPQVERPTSPHPPPPKTARTRKSRALQP